MGLKRHPGVAAVGADPAHPATTLVVMERRRSLASVVVLVVLTTVLVVVSSVTVGAFLWTLWHAAGWGAWSYPAAVVVAAVAAAVGWVTLCAYARRGG